MWQSIKVLTKSELSITKIISNEVRKELDVYSVLNIILHN